MTSGAHNMSRIASMVPQMVPDQIWDVFLLPILILCETSPTCDKLWAALPVYRFTHSAAKNKPHSSEIHSVILSVTGAWQKRNKKLNIHHRSHQFF